MHRLFNHWPTTCSCEINLVADDTPPGVHTGLYTNTAHKYFAGTIYWSDSKFLTHFTVGRKSFAPSTLRYLSVQMYFAVSFFFSVSLSLSALGAGWLWECTARKIPGELQKNQLHKRWRWDEEKFENDALVPLRSCVWTMRTCFNKHPKRAKM